MRRRTVRDRRAVDDAERELGGRNAVGGCRDGGARAGGADVGVDGGDG